MKEDKALEKIYEEVLESNYKYYWYCPACKTPKFYVKSLEDAHKDLEIHENNIHNGKTVGIFGKEIVNERI